MNKLILIIILFSITLNGQNNKCSCFNGEKLELKGANPVMTFTLENTKTYNICGFLNSKISDSHILISDFDIFDCKNGELIFESLSQNSLVSFKNGILEIVETDLLRFGENWGYETIPTGLRQIYYKDSIIHNTVTRPDFKQHKINQKQVDEFLIKIQSTNKEYENENLITIIEKLQVLALIENKKAWKILSNFKSYFNIKGNNYVDEILLSTLSKIKKTGSNKVYN